MAVALALMTLACGRSPSAPTAVVAVALVCTPATVAVARNATSAVTVQVQQSNGTLEDVTATAVWTSSAPAVVTVTAGMIKAVGVGTATVTVAYGGLTRTVDVVARRNTRLAGSIVVKDLDQRYSIHWLKCYLDARMVYSLGFSGGYSVRRVDFPQSDESYDYSVQPGLSTLSLEVRHDLPLQIGDVHYGTSAESYVEIWDSDTNEVLTRLPLSVQAVTVPPVVPTTGEIIWTLTIDVFH